MAKLTTSVRIAPETLQRLEEHNTLRRSVGEKPVTLGSILDDAVSLWIFRDRDRLRDRAQAVLDALTQVD